MSETANSQDPEVSRAERIKRRARKGIRLELRSLGEVRLRHLTIGDHDYLRKAGADDSLTDRAFAVGLLHRKLLKPEIAIGDLARLADVELMLVGRAFVSGDPTPFQFFEDSGHFFRDFRQALRTFEDKRIELLSEAIAPAATALQETLRDLGKEFAPIFKEQIAAVAKLRESFKLQIEHWQSWVAANRSIFQDMARLWVEFQLKYHIAEQRGAQVLEKYKWFMTPGMPIDLLFEVVELDKTRGRNDKAVNHLFVSYFSSDNWRNLEEMVDGWKTDSLLKKRYKILKDCIETVRALDRRGANPANVVLPTLVVQIEGALRDYVALKDPTCGWGYSGLKKAFRRHRPQVLTTNLDDVANDTLLEILFHDSMKGGAFARIPFYFNRHRILHGNTVTYGRKDYMVRAFMLLDFLAWLK